MRHIYDFKKITSSPAPIRRRNKSDYGRKEKFLAILFVLIIGGWVYTFYFSTLFNIKNVRINGLETINKNYITELLNATGRNIFRFNTEKTIKVINETYFLEAVAITKIYPGSIEIKINEKHPAFELHSPNNKYLLDATGLVVEAIQSSSTTRSADKLPLLIDSADQMLTMRQQALDKKVIEAIIFFLDNLKTENNIDVAKTTLNKAEPEVLTFKTTEGFDVITSYREDIKTQLFKLTTFFKAQGDNRKNLLYINARFVDRVYYKFK